MLIDCDSCAVRDLQCGDCVVPVLLGGSAVAADGPLQMDDGERRALDVLADSGLVPRLRLVPTELPAELRPESSRSVPMRSRGVS
ncbi:MAG TPA: hypothetical protein VM433_01830 [Mycobacteriales bacterium]|nr:hypothetical protein [Mycobacteriales bacterium]